MIVSSNNARKLRRALLLSASLFLFACSAVAGDCSHSTILLSAFDTNFRIQPNLQPNDLSAEVDGKRVQVVSLAPDDHPRHIILMVDTSGSMEASRQKTGWGITLPAAGYAVDVMPASASAALVTFSEKLRRESIDFENRKVVGTKVLDLKKRQPQGGTLLFDSIGQVLIEFAELSFGDAIYIVTDGGDNKSKTSFAKLNEKLISRGIRVFVFLVLHQETPEELTGALQMEDLADLTGGDLVQISSAEIAGANRGQLDKLAPRIAGQVENFYRVELGVPAAQRPARVKVSFTDKNRRRSISKLAYSHQIASCPHTIN